MSLGIFGDLFDMNGDGTLDGMEQAMDNYAYYTMMEAYEAEKNGTKKEDDDSGDYYFW